LALHLPQNFEKKTFFELHYLHIFIFLLSYKSSESFLCGSYASGVSLEILEFVLISN